MIKIYELKDIYEMLYLVSPKLKESYKADLEKVFNNLKRNIFQGKIDREHGYKFCKQEAVTGKEYDTIQKQISDILEDTAKPIYDYNGKPWTTCYKPEDHPENTTKTGTFKTSDGYVQCTTVLYLTQDPDEHEDGHWFKVEFRTLFDKDLKPQLVRGEIIEANDPNNIVGEYHYFF